MVAWWYVNKDKKTGPIETDELKRLYQTGEVGAKTMLWHEGMDAWQPLDEVEELYQLNAAVPPPLPAKTDQGRVSYSLATRWPRFFARIFDVWWEVLLIALILGAVLGHYSASYVEWINRSGSSQLLSILCLPAAMMLDALLYWMFGNTPGKALLGLKVETPFAKSLNFLQYLYRNFSIWASGFAFGFPFINLLTMANQARRLGNGQQASYDEPLGFLVRSKPSTWVRKVAFGFAFAGLFVVMLVLNLMTESHQREVILNSAQKNYSWENPLTRLSAKLDSSWKYSVKVNNDGQQIYMFSEQTGHALVVFGMQQETGYALDDYVRAFQKSTTANMHFSDGGRFFEREGHESWQGSGSMVDSTSNRLKVQVVQSGPAFWRVVTIQTMPYDYSDVLVGQLHAALWSTVK